MIFEDHNKQTSFRWNSRKVYLNYDTNDVSVGLASKSKSIETFLSPIKISCVEKDKKLFSAKWKIHLEQ